MAAEMTHLEERKTRGKAASRSASSASTSGVSHIIPLHEMREYQPEAGDRLLAPSLAILHSISPPTTASTSTETTETGPAPTSAGSPTSAATATTIGRGSKMELIPGVGMDFKSLVDFKSKHDLADSKAERDRMKSRERANERNAKKAASTSSSRAGDPSPSPPLEYAPSGSPLLRGHHSLAPSRLAGEPLIMPSLSDVTRDLVAHRQMTSAYHRANNNHSLLQQQRGNDVHHSQQHHEREQPRHPDHQVNIEFDAPSQAAPVRVNSDESGDPNRQHHRSGVSEGHHGHGSSHHSQSPPHTADPAGQSHNFGGVVAPNASDAQPNPRRASGHQRRPSDGSSRWNRDDFAPVDKVRTAAEDDTAQEDEDAQQILEDDGNDEPDAAPPHHVRRSSSGVGVGPHQPRVHVAAGDAAGYGDEDGRSHYPPMSPNSLMSPNDMMNERRSYIPLGEGLAYRDSFRRAPTVLEPLRPSSSGGGGSETVTSTSGATPPQAPRLISHPLLVGEEKDLVKFPTRNDYEQASQVVRRQQSLSVGPRSRHGGTGTSGTWQPPPLALRPSGEHRRGLSLVNRTTGQKTPLEDSTPVYVKMPSIGSFGRSTGSRPGTADRKSGNLPSTSEELPSAAETRSAMLERRRRSMKNSSSSGGSGSASGRKQYPAGRKSNFSEVNTSVMEEEEDPDDPNPHQSLDDLLRDVRQGDHSATAVGGGDEVSPRMPDGGFVLLDEATALAAQNGNNGVNLGEDTEARHAALKAQRRTDRWVETAPLPDSLRVVVTGGSANSSLNSNNGTTGGRSTTPPITGASSTTPSHGSGERPMTMTLSAPPTPGSTAAGTTTPLVLDNKQSTPVLGPTPAPSHEIKELDKLSPRTPGSATTTNTSTAHISPRRLAAAQRRGRLVVRRRTRSQDRTTAIESEIMATDMDPHDRPHDPRGAGAAERGSDDDDNNNEVGVEENRRHRRPTHRYRSSSPPSTAGSSHGSDDTHASTTIGKKLKHWSFGGSGKQQMKPHWESSILPSRERSRIKTSAGSTNRVPLLRTHSEDRVSPGRTTEYVASRSKQNTKCSAAFVSDSHSSKKRPHTHHGVSVSHSESTRSLHRQRSKPPSTATVHEDGPSDAPSFEDVLASARAKVDHQYGASEDSHASSSTLGALARIQHHSLQRASSASTASASSKKGTKKNTTTTASTTGAKRIRRTTSMGGEPAEHAWGHTHGASTVAPYSGDDDNRNVQVHTDAPDIDPSLLTTPSTSMSGSRPSKLVRYNRQLSTDRDDGYEATPSVVHGEASEPTPTSALTRLKSNAASFTINDGTAPSYLSYARQSTGSLGVVSRRSSMGSTVSGITTNGPRSRPSSHGDPSSREQLQSVSLSRHPSRGHNGSITEEYDPALDSEVNVLTSIYDQPSPTDDLRLQHIPRTGDTTVLPRVSASQSTHQNQQRSHSSSEEKSYEPSLPSGLPPSGTSRRSGSATSRRLVKSGGISTTEVNLAELEAEYNRRAALLQQLYDDEEARAAEPRSARFIRNARSIPVTNDIPPLTSRPSQSGINRSKMMAEAPRASVPSFVGRGIRSGIINRSSPDHVSRMEPSHGGSATVQYRTYIRTSAGDQAVIATVSRPFH
jgi:hypothetical protein